eukprot:738892-Rhodomonas_salina.1
MPLQPPGLSMPLTFLLHHHHRHRTLMLIVQVAELGRELCHATGIALDHQRVVFGRDGSRSDNCLRCV